MNATDRRLRLTLLVAAALALLAFRVAVVASWHAPAGDGVQYYSLANELRRADRFAFSPGEAPTYSRLPGYPLFTAALIRHPVSLQRHVEIGAYANVPLDFATAMVVFLILADCGVSRRLSLVGAAAMLLFPSLLVSTCFALSESLATLLLTLELWLILRAVERPQLRWAICAGLVAGAAQLVRADALTLVPAMAVGAVLSSLPMKQRLRAGGLFLAAALLVFSPWPIRNLVRFGAPHVAACTWRTMTGRPLPTGPIEWARTWSSSAPGEAYFEFLMANERPLEVARPGIVIPAMFDSPAERAQVERVFAHYNSQHLSPEVDAEFKALAAERRAAHPFRVFVALPAARVARLWSPIVDWELPFRVRWIPSGAFQAVLRACDWILFALALVGSILLLKSERRRLLILLAPILARSALYSFAIPHGTTGRYLLEAIPLIIVLAVAGLALRADCRAST